MKTDKTGPARFCCCNENQSARFGNFEILGSFEINNSKKTRGYLKNFGENISILFYYCVLENSVKLEIT
jgi:hypothetical protein